MVERRRTRPGDDRHRVRPAAHAGAPARRRTTSIRCPAATPPICCWDLLDSNILNCDERRYIESDATVLDRQLRRADGLAVVLRRSLPALRHPLQACLADPNAGRILIGVRGDTSLTYVDVVPTGRQGNPAPHPAFHCTERPRPWRRLAGRVRSEGGRHRRPSLTIESGDTQAPATSLPDEPYALALDDDPGRGYLYVGHLVGNTSVQDTGGVSLFDVSGTGLVAPGGFPPAPTFIAPFGSPFPPNSSGLFGVTALKLHEPLGVDRIRDAAKQLFVSSRYVPLVTLDGAARAVDLRRRRQRRRPRAVGQHAELESGRFGDARRGVHRSGAGEPTPTTPSGPTRSSGCRPIWSASTSPTT